MPGNHVNDLQLHSRMMGYEDVRFRYRMRPVLIQQKAAGY